MFRKIMKSIVGSGIRTPLTVNKRRLQEENDVHKLFLLTSYHANKGAVDGDHLIQLASESTFEDKQYTVQVHLHEQVKSYAILLNTILGYQTDSTEEIPPGSNQPSQTPPKDPLPESSAPSSNSKENTATAAADPSPRRTSGLAFAMGESESTPPPVKPSSFTLHHPSSALSIAEVNAALEGKLGYSLYTAQSSIGTQESGLGLFVRGHAPLGAIIAFYPGVVYPLEQHRLMAHYPKVDTGNPFLLARFDGAVVDGKPWGGSHTLPRSYPFGPSLNDQEAESGGGKEDLKINYRWSVETAWHRLNTSAQTLGTRSGDKETRSQLGEDARSKVELHNPLALGHFANHPPPGHQPNIMPAAYDLPVQDPDLAEDEGAFLRRSVPNVFCGGEASGNLSLPNEANALNWHQSKLPCIVLVATRPLHDGEEVFLNYRLSPATRPKWYTPVDTEEDKRRWA